MAPLPCKTPLLLLGIIGLVATLLEFEEGHVTLPIKKLQNITKHHFFHLVNRVRYKCDSTLDQVGAEWYWGVNSTHEMFPSSAFWAKITLVKRWSFERNQ
jgi:hypothetical protein